MFFSISLRLSAIGDGKQEEEEVAGESTVPVGAHGIRPKRGVHEARRVYGREQQTELEERQMRCRKCKVAAREGISEFYLWQVEFPREEVQAWP